MILVITFNEIDEDTGKLELLASHGVNPATGRNVVLPNVHPRQLGARIDGQIGGWVIEGCASEHA